MVNFEKNFQNFSLIFFLKKRNVLLILTYLLFIKFGLNHTEFHMDFSQSNPQRNFKGFTLELAIPEDGFPLDFYWMDTMKEIINISPLLSSIGLKLLV
ncbi:unnamed protein product [Rhizophagus irregularis]|nr:unnamed protein product [Rhizophagus irregularis]